MAEADIDWFRRFYPGIARDFIAAKWLGTVA
jgi:hypothetical protein